MLDHLGVTVDWNKAAMVALLAVLFVWWVLTWKKRAFAAWWEDKDE